ncbi:MAG: hypothetical protein JXQ80_11645 [Bacteroidales bacterium]|nr:hypothetical protein [Bacteroidales bacterium]
MKPNESTSASFDEQQSLQVIQEMIQVSQKKLKNDGILFIIWGWSMFFNYAYNYLLGFVVLPYPLKKAFDYAGNALAIVIIAYSLYYILKQRKKVQTYIGISLRYVWFSLIACLVLTSLIIHNVLHATNFELQHPIFMMFIAFATVITGGILRYRMIIFGGIIFGILAYICSYIDLREQLILEAIAWLIAFIIPGHLLYAKRKN